MCRVRCSAAADVTSSAACLMNWPASFEGSCGRLVCFCIHFHGLPGYSNVRSHTEQISLNAGRETFKTILIDAWRQVWGKVGVPLQLCGQAQFAGVDVAVQRAARCAPMAPPGPRNGQHCFSLWTVAPRQALDMISLGCWLTDPTSDRSERALASIVCSGLR